MSSRSLCIDKTNRCGLRFKSIAQELTGQDSISACFKSYSKFFFRKTKTRKNNFFCLVGSFATMATLLDSEAALVEKAKEFGLTAEEIATLKSKGLVSLSKVAYALTTPGVNPSDEALTGLLAEEATTVTLGSLASIRQLMFEAQTMCIQAIRNRVDGSEPSKRPELAPAERAARIKEQQKRLAGYDLSGPLECSHSSYDMVGEMLQKDAVCYLSPTKFGTRSTEVSKEKPPREVVVGSSSLLTVANTQRDDKCSVHTDLLLSQAMTRRALAFDLMSAASFNAMEGWHRFLFSHLEHQPVSGYSQVSAEQIMKADKQAWIRLAEIMTTLKKDLNGKMPLDEELKNLRTDPQVVFLLLPLPAHKSSVGGQRQQQPQHKRQTSPHAESPQRFKKRKGGGKGKGKKGTPNMPEEIRGMKSNTSSGERICWNYNLTSQKCQFAKPGQSCKRGRHVCMKCEGNHPQFEHEKAS